MGKKLLGLLLALALLLGCAVSLAGDEWVDCHCDEEGFTTKISVNGSAGYVNERGMVGIRSYLGVPGYPPFVQAHRRSMDKKFNNPQNYLNNTYREFLENKYGGDSQGMNPAKTWEVGGKKLIGARYMYKVGDSSLIHLQLIEVRDLGDVEYTALYEKSDEDKVMKALDAMVESYVEDEAKSSAGGGTLLEPVDTAGQAVNVENGTFWTQLTGLEHIDSGGFFYAELYQEDAYPVSAVESLQAGDRVKIENQVYTVQSIKASAKYANTLELETVEDTLDLFLFTKVDDQNPDRGNYHLTKNYDAVTHYCMDYQVMLPLANAFQFAWVDGEDVQLRDADDFLRLLREGILPEAEMTKETTALQFNGGLVTVIVHAEY